MNLQEGEPVRPFVLFDLDNTLVDRRHALAKWSTRFCNRHGLGAHEAEWLHELLKERAVPGTFVGVREYFGLTETAEQLWKTYCADIAAAVHCPSDVLAGLDRLRATGWRVGIATNGSADIQRAKLKTTGIDRHVDAVCISEEAGARKPDGVFFHEAIRRCHGGAGGVGWMIGDNPVNDIDGGREAGLRTVWINHGAAWPDELAGPDHEVSSVRAAINLMAAAEPMKGPR